MKKNYTFYTVLLFIPLMAFLFLGYSSGQTLNYSGSPGDSGNTCTVCHTSGANHNASVSIQTDIPAAGYELNQTYTITVSGTSSVTKHGFQITAEKTGGNKVGTFTAGSDSQTGDSNHLVTHTASGNMQSSWTFTWTSPSNNQGDITFYAVLNATNFDGSTSGDQVVTTSQSYSLSNIGYEDYTSLDFELFPNPAASILKINYENLNTGVQVSIYDMNGRKIISKEGMIRQLDISNLQRGIYFLTVIDGGNKGVKRFVKE